MITSLLCFYASSQKAVPVDYTVPLGASSEFHTLVTDVETKLASKQFEPAYKLAMSLPQSVVSYRIDLSKVPEDAKASYRQSATFAFDSWQKSLDGMATLSERKSGRADILISFEPELAPIAETKEIPGATWFFSLASNEPRIETVIGLKKTAAKLATLDSEVHNEVLNAIGLYFGLAPSPLFGNATGRINGRMANYTTVNQSDRQLAASCLRLAKALRIAASKKVVVKPATPSLFIESSVIQFKSAFQGDTAIEQMTVANRGEGVLLLHAKGDCSCISGSVVQRLKPGETAALKATYRTDELVGDIRHGVILTTNDPERPAFRIPANIRVEPRAEVVFPNSDTLVLDGSNRKVTFYVHSSEPVKWVVKEAKLYPDDLPITFEPFSGNVPDWAKGGATRPVKGYKVTADFTKSKLENVFGRVESVAFLTLTNPKMPLVKANIYLQRGIVSQPESIYMGAPLGPVETRFVLMRPGKPFKILGITSDSQRLTGTVESNRFEAEYTIRVNYDGKALEHRLQTNVRIKTNDPGQPEIVIPVSTASQ